MHIATGKLGAALAQRLTGRRGEAVQTSAANARLSRARDQLKEALTAVHLARLARGGSGCPELVGRFEKWAAPTLPSLDRRWVQDHRRECADCRKTLYVYPLTGHGMAARALELLGRGGIVLGRRHAASPNKAFAGPRRHGFLKKVFSAAAVAGTLAVATGVPGAADRPAPIVAPNITTSRIPTATPAPANQQVVTFTTPPTAHESPGSTHRGPGRPRSGEPEATPTKQDPKPGPTKTVTTPILSNPTEVTVTTEVTRASYTGPCPPSADTAPRFRATIRVNKGPVKVSYQWLTSNGGSSDPDLKTITFNGTGPQARTVQHSETSYLPDRTTTDTMTLYLVAPHAVRSNSVSYSTTCEIPEPPRATVTAEAIRDSYSGPCPPPAGDAPRFRATIRVNRGPVTVSYQWLTSNGGSSDPELKTITFDGTGPQERTVEHTEMSYLPDKTVTDWVALYVRVPNDARSNKVSYTTTCD